MLADKNESKINILTDSNLHTLDRQLIIGHIYVNNSMKKNVLVSAVIKHSLSDHFPRVVQLNFKINRKNEIRPL